MTPIENRKLARRMLKRLCAFPTFSLTRNKDMADAYVKVITEMLNDFGFEATQEALAAAVRQGGKFAPSAGDIRTLVARNDEVEHLKSLLYLYGEHLMTCGVPIGKAECTCGFAEIEAKLDTQLSHNIPAVFHGSFPR